ncbi:MAG TPA: wax ester/triacylglycerol synthase family O-acyltransferase [Burkholderiales bacterium]|nr:wax ester/triacylglycerol synthase family O-acyltransferase [Burkholderiales bacterium]
MSARESMSAVDTAWLRMDRPTNPMMVVVVMVFDHRLNFERFRSLIERRFLRHRRFRQRVVLGGESAHWEDSENFDMSFHLRRIGLPRPGGKRELYDLVSDLASTPLDPARPLWQFQLVDRFGSGSAVIARIHHCYADGIALVKVLLGMTDEGDQAAQAHGHPETEEASDGLLSRWLGPVADTLDVTWRTGSALVGTYFDLLLHPSHAFGYARRSIDLATEATRLALMPSDSPTRFKGTPSGSKRVAWSDRLALDEVKALAHATDCSVNDVLLSCAAGVLQAYLKEQGDPVEGVELRALVPVNLRAQEDVQTLGNHFGLVAVLLPLGIENPLARLFEVKRRMSELKASSQALVSLGLLAAVGMAPKRVQDEILDLLTSRASAVMTNVPGPQQPLHMTGARIKEIVFWVPQTGDIGMGISILSYDDGVQFGVVTDRNILADPEPLAQRFAAQFEHLLRDLSGRHKGTKKSAKRRRAPARTGPSSGARRAR